MPASLHACRQHGSTADMVKGMGGRNQPNCMCAEREDLKEMSAVGDGPLPIGGSVSSLRELDLLGHPAGDGAAIRARTSETAGRRRVRRTAVDPRRPDAGIASTRECLRSDQTPKQARVLCVPTTQTDSSRQKRQAAVNFDAES
jgi:hypothetical protein